MKKNSSSYKWFLMALFLMFCFSAGTVLAADNLSISSGKAGGTWYPMGVAALYPAPLQIVVRGDSDIKTIADLKGKRIAPGLKGTSGEVLVRNILKVYGLSYDDMAKIEHLAYADAAMLMKDGHIDAFMPFTTVPAPVIQDTAVSISGGVRIVSLSQEKFDELKKINEGYSAFTVPGGQYKGHDTDSLFHGLFRVPAYRS